MGRHRRQWNKDTEHDALRQSLATVNHMQRKWLDRGVVIEDVKVVTKLLLETRDNRLLHQLLVFLLEWVRHCSINENLEMK